MVSIFHGVFYAKVFLSKSGFLALFSCFFPLDFYSSKIKYSIVRLGGFRAL